MPSANQQVATDRLSSIDTEHGDDIPFYVGSSQIETIKLSNKN